MCMVVAYYVVCTFTDRLDRHAQISNQGNQHEAVIMNTQESQKIIDALKTITIDQLDFANKFFGWDQDSLYQHLCESGLPLTEALKKYYNYTQWDWCKELAETYNITPECVLNYLKKMGNAVNLGELKKKLSQIKPRGIPKHTFRFFNVFSFIALMNPNRYVRYSLFDDRTHVIAKKINSKKYENVLLYSKNWSGINWEDFCILNAIYSVIADTKPGIDGKYRFCVREVYETLYPSRRWYRISDDVQWIFIHSIAAIINSISKIPCEISVKWNSFELKFDDYNACCLRDLFGKFSLEEGLIFTVKSVNIISLADAQKRIVPIESKMLTYGKNIKGGEFLKLYIARQICLAQNPKNNIRQVILIDTLREVLGPGAISHSVINGYMSYLMRQGYISSFSITAKKITWDGASDKKQAVKQKKDKKITERLITILKDADKKIIENAEKPDEIQEREKKLREYNLFISKHHITDGNSKTLTTHLRQEFCQGD